MFTCQSWPTRIVAVVAITVAAIGAAQAQSSDDWTRCLNRGQTFTRDIALGGCTALIQSNERGRNLAGAYYTRGSLYQDSGDSDRAIADFSSAIQVDAGFSEAYNARGNSYADKGDLDRAIGDFDMAIRLRPSDPLAYNGRGNAYRNKGDSSRAIPDYIEAIRLDPQYAVAYSNRALAELKLGNFADAVLDFDTSLRLDPDRPAALFGRGFAKLKGGDVSGEADIAAAKSRQADIATIFAGFGLPEPTAMSVDRPRDICAAAQTHWTSAESIGTLQAYQDHLARFPSCAFAALAAERIEALRRRTATAPAVCDAREVLRDGQCIARTCPAGTSMDEDGACVRKREPAKTTEHRPARRTTAAAPRSAPAALDCTNPIGLMRCAEHIMSQH